MTRIPKKLCETHTLGPATGEWLVSARQVPSFRATHLRVAGYSDARRGYAFVRHNPAFSQLLACTAGEGEVLVDGRWQRCRAGDAYVTAPHALCAYHVRPGARWQICWVLYEEPMQLPGVTSGDSPRVVRMDAAGLHRVIEGLCQEARGSAEPAAMELWAALVHRHALRGLQSQNDAQSRLSALWSAVRRDLPGPWTLTQMATMAGMSQESLRRRCWREVSRSPLAYLTQLRMLFAADLLTCTPEKIAVIANRVGYADAFAFSNAFKREMGQPPSHFRRQSKLGA